MKSHRNHLFAVACLVYLLYGLASFPYLRITFMLFSIPLGMLGGWNYGYRGAALVTAACIPLHYLILNIHSDDPAIILEAFNPFGIGSQLLFSCCSTLLRITHDKYITLNTSLEHLVAERTRDLEELTHYLIEAQHLENREWSAGLVAKPYNELKQMMATGAVLKKSMEQSSHPRVGDADNIHLIISQCIKQLKSMEELPISRTQLPGDLFGSVQTLIQQCRNYSSVRITAIPSPCWNEVDENKAPLLYEIIFEAVGNALRHADPRQIEIQLTDVNGQCRLRIDNDGTPLTAGPQEGMGLPLMRYRAAKINGVFSITSLPDNRTRVECSFPAKR